MSCLIPTWVNWWRTYRIVPALVEHVVTMHFNTHQTGLSSGKIQNISLKPLSLSSSSSKIRCRGFFQRAFRNTSYITSNSDPLDNFKTIDFKLFRCDHKIIPLFGGEFERELQCIDPWGRSLHCYKGCMLDCTNQSRSEAANINYFQSLAHTR